MRQASSLRALTEGLAALQQRLADAQELAALEDPSLADELAAEVGALQADLGHRETEAMLSGEYDRGNAILAIHAGAGGTDSQDWAAMLLRMYLRWAEQSGFSAELLDSSDGEEAGLKSATVAVDGENAFGYLQAERGVHRLVRLSPFDSAHRRHTSFALVEVLPQVDSSGEVVVNPADLRIDTYRSAGAGGQNVQKNETAIRITHLPTGLVVTCQNERSQTQNRENALRVLRARLGELQRQEKEQALAKIKGEHVKAEWGSQIRSYVLHPYQLVKDHRTGHEMGNTTAVLDGEIEGFIDAYLRSDRAGAP
jgi:peptide chain release factor 2